MRLGFVITTRCNAACLHCSTDCGPDRSEALGTDEVRKLMDDAARIDDGIPLGFAISGGEPFLDLAALEEVIRHGSGLGAQVTCVTNGSWALSDNATLQKLGRVKAAGLSWLAVSVSRFHQRFVPLSRIRRLLECARTVGLPTELKGAVTREDCRPGGLLDQWQRELSADEISIFPVLRYLRSGQVLDEGEYHVRKGLPREACPSMNLTIESDGAAYTCCAPGSANSFLKIGDISSHSVEDMHQRLIRLSKQRILRENGPAFFADAVIAAGMGNRLRDAYAGPCDLCLHIANEPDMRRIAEACAQAEDVALLRRALGPKGTRERSRSKRPSSRRIDGIQSE